MELPGQFPDEKLYNLDVWDEQWWLKQALIKKANRELKQLQFSYMGTHGGEDYKRTERDLIHRINMLSPPSEEDRSQIYAASWAFLKMKKRG